MHTKTVDILELSMYLNSLIEKYGREYLENLNTSIEITLLDSESNQINGTISLINGLYDISSTKTSLILSGDISYIEPSIDC